MNLYQNGYMKLSYNYSLSLMEQQWTMDTKDLTKNRKDCEQLISLLNSITCVQAQKYKPTGVLIDSQACDYTVHQNVKVWKGDNLGNKMSSSGVSKVAFVVKKNVLKEVAASHSFQKLGTKKLTFRYFDNLREAKEWLLQQN